MFSKRLVIIFIFLIAAIALCGKKSDLAIRYEMEKMVYNAEQLRKQSTIKDSLLSDEALQSLVVAYQKIADYIPQAKDSFEVAQASEDKKQAWSLASLANIKIGLLYMDAKKYADAYAYFDKVANNPATTPAQLNGVMGYLALSKAKTLDYPEAARFYANYADGYLYIIDPQNPDLNAMEAYLRSAEALKHAGDSSAVAAQFDEARAYYRLIIGKYPDTPAAYLAFGKIIASYLKQARYNDAIKLIETQKERNSNLFEPELLLMMADIYANDFKNSQKAAEAYSEFIKTYPDYDQLASARLGLGLMLFKMQKYADARKAVENIETLPKVKPGQVADSYYLTARCYENENRWEKALNQFDLLVATFPGSAKAYEAKLYMANYYKQKKQTNLATRSFQDAEDYIAKFADPQTGGPTIISQSMYYTAKCYEMQGQYDKAVAQLDSLYHKYPNQSYGQLALLHSADIYETNLNDKARAMDVLNSFIRVYPDANNYDEVVARIQTLQ